MEATHILTHELKQLNHEANSGEQLDGSSSIKDESSSDLDDMTATYHGPKDAVFGLSQGIDISDSESSDLDEMTAKLNYAAHTQGDSNSLKNRSIYSFQLDSPVQPKECAEDKVKQRCFFREVSYRVPTLLSNKSSDKISPMCSPKSILMLPRFISILKFREFANIGLISNKHFVQKNVILKKPLAQLPQCKSHLAVRARLNMRPYNYRFNRSKRFVVDLPHHTNRYIFNKKCRANDLSGKL